MTTDAGYGNQPQTLRTRDLIDKEVLFLFNVNTNANANIENLDIALIAQIITADIFWENIWKTWKV